MSRVKQQAGASHLQLLDLPVQAAGLEPIRQPQASTPVRGQLLPLPPLLCNYGLVRAVLLRASGPKMSFPEL